MQKIPFYGHFWSFLPKIGPMRIFQEYRAPSVFSSRYLIFEEKKSKETNEPILKKSVNRQTDRRTDGRTDGQIGVILKDLPAKNGSKSLKNITFSFFPCF